ncbi:MAG: hypothetical protein LH660_17115 [Phormidesmis sp. CAN_BIN36]|nr:hypothetical protein [Phormidesmis sp. CAN_BIN36]
MQLITQEIVAQSATDTVSLYYLTAALGSGKHVLFLVHAHQGQVIAAYDYSLDMVKLIADETDGKVIADPIGKKARVEYVQSSKGDLAIELLKERTTLRRDPSGDWTIYQKENVPNSNSAVGITIL